MYPIFSKSYKEKYRNYDYNVHPLYFEYPKETVYEIVYQYESELDFGFPGFVDIYEHLAQIIPNYFIVIDFGCYFAAQCWYFRNHIKYIGVDNCKTSTNIPFKRFSIDNTYHYQCTIEYFMKYLAKDFNPEYTFAICNFVNTSYTELITKYFMKCFCYFPTNYENSLSPSEYSNHYKEKWIAYLLKDHEIRNQVVNILKDNKYGNN